jgi:phytoene desaturase
MAKRHVVVIGAGPGGLATAMQLAHAGAKVTLLEAKERVGGRCSAIETDGFRFDVGPTFFLYPRILQEIFQSVGLDLQQEVPMRRLDPQYRITFGGGGKIDATPQMAQMEKEICALSPQDAGSLKRYLDDNRVKLEKFRPILESPFNGWLDFLRPALLGAAPFVKPWKSLGDELQSYFKDPRLAIAFSFQSKYLGMSPFRCPSLFSILSFLEYEYGVFHPMGGCARVSERMGELCQQMGVDLRLGSPVTGLEFSGRRVTGVRVGDEKISADAIVINADFSQAMTKLVPDALRRKWTDKKISNKKFSCSTFMLYLGIEGKYENLPHHNIHISTDYQRNLRQIEQDFQLPDDPSFYVQNASVTDPSLAPDGHSAMYILVPVPHQHPNVTWDQAQAAAYRELTLNKLSAIGLGDLRSRIKVERMITPADWNSSYEVYRGATFNLAHGLDQMLHRRPHNRFEDLDGVYLVGGGTHPGSGLPVIYESTRITCKQLLPTLGLPTEFISACQPPTDKPVLASI